MGLREDLTQDLIAAQKSGDTARRSTIRQILNEVKNREIESRAPLSDGDMHAVVAKLVSQHNDSIAQFKQGGRTDLVEKESAERAVLEGYLPPPLTDQALDTLITAAIDATDAHGPKQMGAVMKALKADTAGRADGTIVSAKVKTRLVQLAGPP